MKKFLLILLSLTLCACQTQTKSTTSTSKKACDVTSEEKTCNTKDDTKTNFNEISFDEAIQYFTQEKYISDFQVVLGVKKQNPF